MERSSAPSEAEAAEGLQAVDAYRAGRYVVQPQGYRAFMPAPLPPKPPVHLEGQLQALLSQADQALGRLDGSIQTLPDPDLFVFMYVRKEAVLSSQIEGTQSSLQDVLAAEARLRTPDRARDTGEVINYVTAMNYGLERLATLPISSRPDPGNPRTTAARRPRVPDAAGRTAYQSELDRPRRLHAPGGHVRPAPAP